ncbi:MAG TPA: hypothetical protein ENK60_06910 [Anaerolineae bacterium]|nr:hypothetical protein [Anaerolineae bacterium]
MSFRLTILTLLLLLLLAFAFPVSSQSSQGWQALGPEGGPVLTLARAPSNPNVIYAGTRTAGVFRSEDGGVHWRSVSDDLPFTEVWRIAVDPNDADTVYAASTYTITKSIDGGVTWDIVLTAFLGLRSPPMGVAAVQDPEGSTVLYAWGDTDNDGGRLYRSVDGGAQWDVIAHLGHIMTVVKHDRASPALYVATNKGVFRSEDMGETWRSIFSVPIYPFWEKLIQTLAVVPGDSPELYVGINRIVNLSPISPQVARSFDDGQSWDSITSWEGQVQKLYALVHDPFFSSAYPYGLYAATDVGVFALSDEVWRDDSFGLPPGPIYDLVIAVNPQRTFWAGGEFGLYRRIYRSTPESPGSAQNPHPQSLPIWEPSQKGLYAKPIYQVVVDPNTPSTLYAWGDEFYRSDDRGATWLPLGEGLPEKAWWMLAASPSRPTRLYMATSGGLFMSDDRGEEWQRLQKGLTETKVFSVAVDPARPWIVYAGTSKGLFRSETEGETWHYVDTGNSNYIFDIAVDPQRPQRIWINRYGRVLLSEDEGWTWRRIGRFDIGSQGRIVIHPYTPDTIFLCGSRGLLRSEDGGQHWRYLTHGLPEGPIRDLVVDPSDGQVLYVGGKEGIFRSADGGETWELFDEGAMPRDAVSLDITPVNGDALYAASERSGVYRYDFPRPRPFRLYWPRTVWPGRICVSAVKVFQKNHGFMVR